MNDVIPTATQERETMQDEFRNGVIEPLQMVLDALGDAEQYLRSCPGHHAEIARMASIGGEVEDLITDLGGTVE